MIISRAPLRLPLAGGGTDLESFYLGRGASWISVSINKYCYSLINDRFDSNFLIKYSQLEEVSNINGIKHNLIRETLRFFKINKEIELTFSADIPGSTGLGSSSAFLVSLITCINTYLNLNLTKENFAQIATKIEKDILNEPIGLQDQFISALGGIKKFEVSSDGKLTFYNLPIEEKNLSIIQNSLVLIYTGIKRESKSILSNQVKDVYEGKNDVLERLEFVKSQVPYIENALIDADLIKLGNLFHEHWCMKVKQSSEMSNSYINDLYTKAINFGSLGGKLVGAGGGGFLLMVVENVDKFLIESKKSNLMAVPFRFEAGGASTLLEY